MTDDDNMMLSDDGNSNLCPLIYQTNCLSDDSSPSSPIDYAVRVFATSIWTTNSPKDFLQEEFYISLMYFSTDVIAQEKVEFINAIHDSKISHYVQKCQHQNSFLCKEYFWCNGTGKVYCEALTLPNKSIKRTSSLKKN